MPRLGPLELAIILVIVLLIFGVGRLPQVGSSLGRSMRAFKRAVTGEEEAELGEDEGQVKEPARRARKKKG